MAMDPIEPCLAILAHFCQVPVKNTRITQLVTIVCIIIAFVHIRVQIIPSICLGGRPSLIEARSRIRNRK